MNVIVCVDDNNGMMFNHRRQSRDEFVVQDIIKLIGDHKLYISPYSIQLFEGYSDINIIANSQFLELAGETDYCFVEDSELLPCVEKIEKIIIYKWNRVYPADFYFDLNPETGWMLESAIEFKGNSHETITREVFCK